MLAVKLCDLAPQKKTNFRILKPVYEIKVLNSDG